MSNNKKSWRVGFYKTKKKKTIIIISLLFYFTRLILSLFHLFISTLSTINSFFLLCFCCCWCCCSFYRTNICSCMCVLCLNCNLDEFSWFSSCFVGCSKLGLTRSNYIFFIFLIRFFSRFVVALGFEQREPNCVLVVVVVVWPDKLYI